jgi:S-phase kinase-associated protein 1
MVILVSNDAVEHAVPTRVALHSGLVRGLLDLIDNGECDSERIPLKEVDSATLRAMIEWCETHGGTFTPDTEDLPDDCTDPKGKALPKEKDLICAMVHAADYMDMQVLITAGVAALANIITGKTVEQLRDFCQFPDDFTPEEKETVRRENQWVMDALDMRD